MTEKQRKVFSRQIKAKVALEAIRGIRTVNEIGLEFGVHPTQLGLRKKELHEQAASLFDSKSDPKPVDQSTSPERLYSEIGRLLPAPQIRLNPAHKSGADFHLSTQ